LRGSLPVPGGVALAVAVRTRRTVVKDKRARARRRDVLVVLGREPRREPERAPVAVPGPPRGHKGHHVAQPQRDLGRGARARHAPLVVPRAALDCVGISCFFFLRESWP
jgi:hypothetical protein